ncbi:ANTAR domain-containing protein [Clostridium botulinum]|nr:ANTAR domain-containing protein [Clostridium botulinum]
MVEFRGKIIIALSNMETNKKLKNILMQENYEILALCTSGNELIRNVIKYSPDLVLVGYKFKDMNLLDVYEKLYEFTSFLALVNEPYRSFIEDGSDIYCIGTKISAVILKNSIDLIFQGKKRIIKLQQQVENLERTLESRKKIEKAKWKIMSDRKMIENDAFRYIQRLSMNLGKTMIDIATLILDDKL